jgi:polyhydroxybutyrate depolymerase
MPNTFAGRWTSVVVSRWGLIGPWAALCLLLVASCSHAAGSPTEGMQTLTHQGMARSYVVRLPAGASTAGQRWPMVIVLHGGGGDAGNAEKMTGFTDKGHREGFVVVYPEGTGRLSHHLLTWNAGHCCGRAMEQRVDDVGFIRVMIDKMLVDYPVDSKRIYATGMSNGAMMSHRLGIELPDRLAAIAPVMGAVFGDEKKPASPVAALMINGQLDRSVPVAGGPPGGRFADAWEGTPAQPSEAQGRFWAAANGCEPQVEPKSQATVTRWRYTCPSSRAVELVVVADNGHAWPGGKPGSRLGDPPSASLSATDEIWAFFKANPK